MRNRIISVVIGVVSTLLAFQSYGQFNDHIDVPIVELKKELATTQSDTTKVCILIELAFKYYSIDIDSCIKYGESAYAVSQEMSWQAAIAKADLRLGAGYLDKGIDSLGRYYYNHALEISHTLGDSSGEGAALLGLATLYSKQKRNDSAIALYEQALQVILPDSDWYNYAQTHLNIGLCYQRLGEYEKALGHYQVAKSIFAAKNSLGRLASVYRNEGALYGLLNAFDTAEAAYQKAIEFYQKDNAIKAENEVLADLGRMYSNIGRFDAAQQNLLEAWEYFNEKGQSRWSAELSNDLGALYLKMELLDEAKTWLDRSKMLSEAGGYFDNLIKTKWNFAVLHAKSEEPEKELAVYESLLLHYDTTQSPTRLLKLYGNIAAAYVRNQDYKSAYQFERKKNAVDDDLQEKLLAGERATEKLQLEQLKTHNLSLDLQNAENAQRLRLLTVILISVLVLSVAVYIIIVLRQRDRKRQLVIAQQQAALKDQEIKELLRSQELAALDALMEGQEGERKRIAQELHDRLGSMLAMVKLHFNTVNDSLDALKQQARERYEEANTLLDQACEEVRRVAHDMSSGFLVEFGLIPTLKELGDSITKSGEMSVEVLDFGFEERLDPTLEITVYRTLQELIGNVLKHAKAKELTIQLIKKGDNLNVVVEDDGVGFDLSSIENKQGMGLSGTRNRIESQNGTLVIDSSPGNGTTVTINVPL